MRLLSRSILGLALAFVFGLGVIATTPDTVFSCGQWPEPPCCKPGQACFGGGPGTGGGGGKMEAAPEIPEGPAGALLLFERLLDLF
jgi:hypothetical protein